jgi:hypothetical protein
MTPREVTPSEHAAFFNESIRRLQSSYGCLLAVDEQNRSVAKATAAFVGVGPFKMLVTARHVVRSEKLIGRKLLLLLSRLAPDGLAVVGEQTVPISIPLELEVLWDSEALDVAFLGAPPQLVAMAEARFFEAAFHADAATGLRTRWRADHSDTTSLPYFVLGFPNFGHLVNDEQRRVETLSTAALPAYVTQFEDFPWDGHGSPAPQMSLEADAREDGLVVGATSAMQEEISRRLFHPREEEGEPLGGFSGGPVVVVGEDGEFLLGIIKEGKPLFGTHFRVAASCWDDCFTAFGRAVAKKG